MSKLKEYIKRSYTSEEIERMAYNDFTVLKTSDAVYDVYKDDICAYFTKRGLRPSSVLSYIAIQAVCNEIIKE